MTREDLSKLLETLSSTLVPTVPALASLFDLGRSVVESSSSVEEANAKIRRLIDAEPWTAATETEWGQRIAAKWPTSPE